MTTPVLLSPIWNGQQFSDNNGGLLNSGKIFTFAAGSTTSQLTTYSEPTGTTANTNPIVLDSSGRIPVEIWLELGVAYQLILATADSTPTSLSPLQAVDNVVASPQSSTAGSPGTNTVWNEAATPSYVSSTQITVPGNVTANFYEGNRVMGVNGSNGTWYGTVTASSFSSGNTQVTVIVTGGNLLTSLSAVYWSANVANGKTVDAAGVSFSSGYPYVAEADTTSVGYQLAVAQANITANAATAAAVSASLQLVYATTGTSTAYVLTPSVAATSYSSNQSYNVAFNQASGASPTLNVSGLGAIAIMQYGLNGSLVPAIISANQTSIVLYNATLNQFILQSPVPQFPTGQVSWSLYNCNATSAGFPNVALTWNSLVSSLTGCSSVNTYGGTGIEVSEAGTYFISASVTIDTNSGASIIGKLYIYKNGVNIGPVNGINAQSADVNGTATISAIIPASANDVFTCYFAASGGSNCFVVSGYGSFCGFRIS